MSRSGYGRTAVIHTEGRVTGDTLQSPDIVLKIDGRWNASRVRAEGIAALARRNDAIRRDPHGEPETAETWTVAFGGGEPERRPVPWVPGWQGDWRVSLELRPGLVVDAWVSRTARIRSGLQVHYGGEVYGAIVNRHAHILAITPEGTEYDIPARGAGMLKPRLEAAAQALLAHRFRDELHGRK